MQFQKTLIYSNDPDIIRPLLSEVGAVEVGSGVTPDFVIAHGGDGTFLNAERDWPGVPKLFLRRSRVSPDAAKSLPKKALQALQEGSLQIKEFAKAALYHGRTEAVATSDIILRNLNPNQALRFGLEKYFGVTTDEIIGDGLVLATPIGARGYYRSITRQIFQEGFGLGFNNPTEPLNPILLPNDFSIEIRIHREMGILCIDNLPCFWLLRADETVLLKKHPQKTRLLDVLPFYPKPTQERLGF